MGMARCGIIICVSTLRFIVDRLDLGRSVDVITKIIYYKIYDNDGIKLIKYISYLFL